MHQLIYLSSAKDLYTDEELESILAISRKNNTDRNVTGVLLYHDGAILQVLEGEAKDIDELMKKIEKDDRHYGVITVVEHEVSQRFFADWSMGFRRVSAKDWNLINGYVPVSAVQNNPQRVNDNDQQTLIVFLQSFCKVNFG